eukprot:scaffold3100_cov110-Isochrysis_galbana.AAC.4
MGGEKECAAVERYEHSPEVWVGSRCRCGVHLVEGGEEGMGMASPASAAGPPDAVHVVFNGEGEGEVDHDLGEEGRGSV